MNRWITIALSLICFSAVAAEKTNSATSVEAFAKQVREAYEKKDAEWMLKHSFTNKVPAEIVAAQAQLYRFAWGSGDLEVTSVETFRFEDYKPTAAPGEFNGRKLRFIVKPTHWVVLKAASPKPKDGSSGGVTAEIKLELPLFEKEGQWKIAGGTYADRRRK